MLPEVLDEFVATEQRCPANPASSHAAGRRARGVLEEARERIAKLFELPGGDVVFTSGGTEAANMAVRGLGNQELPVLIIHVGRQVSYRPAALGAYDIRAPTILGKGFDYSACQGECRTSPAKIIIGSRVLFIIKL